MKTVRIMRNSTGWTYQIIEKKVIYGPEITIDKPDVIDIPDMGINSFVDYEFVGNDGDAIISLVINALEGKNSDKPSE